MKILLITPIPIEYNAAGEMLGLKEDKPIVGCRVGTSRLESHELFVVQSGPAKARAAMATMAAIGRFSPELVLDTGSCAGIQQGIAIGQIVVGKLCYEYDISGTGIPRSMLPAMKLHSAFEFMETESADRLIRGLVEAGRTEGHAAGPGVQACGEYLVNSIKFRTVLHNLFNATGANWETAAVFMAALRSMIPVFSLRTVTDYGNKDALRDFRAHVKQANRGLYAFVRSLCESGWFSGFQNGWRQVKPVMLESMVKSVLL